MALRAVALLTCSQTAPARFCARQLSLCPPDRPAKKGLAMPTDGLDLRNCRAYHRVSPELSLACCGRLRLFSAHKLRADRTKLFTSGRMYPNRRRTVRFGRRLSAMAKFACFRCTEKRAQAFLGRHRSQPQGSDLRVLSSAREWPWRRRGARRLLRQAIITILPKYESPPPRKKVAATAPAMVNDFALREA